MFSNYTFFTVCCAHVIAVATYLCMHAEQWMIVKMKRPLLTNPRHWAIFWHSKNTSTTLDQVLLQHPRKQAHVSIGNRSKQRSYTAVLMNKFKNTTRSAKQRGFWKEMYMYIENTWRTHEQIISNYISIVRKNTLVLWHSFNYESQFKAALGLAGKYCVWKLKKKNTNDLHFLGKFTLFPCKICTFL